MATAILRVAHLVDHLRSGLSEPESVLEYSDMSAFSEWAHRIVAGDVLSVDTYHPYPDFLAEVAPLETFERWWGGGEIFHQTPLYAYVLALSYWLTGGKVALLLLQIAGSVLSVYLVYRIGSRVSDVRAGLFAAGLAGTYAPSIFFDTMLLRASLTASLTVASIWLLMRVRDTGRVPLAFGTGAVLAAGYLMRPVGLALLAGLLVLLVDPMARATWRRWALPLVAGLAIGFSPFVARNAIVGAPLLTFSNRGVEAMVQGNNSAADPAFLTLPNSEVYRDLMEAGAGSVPRALMATIGTWPEDGRVRWWLWHEARKLLAIARNYEYANNVNFYFFRRATPLLPVLPTFGVVFSLGLVGTGLLLKRGRDRTGALLLALAAGGLVGIMLLALAAGRYRLPLAVITTIPAGVTLSALWEWIARRRIRAALLCGGAVAAVAFVSWRAVPTRVLFDADEQPHFIRGADARLYEEMAALRPREFTEETRLLGQRGETDEARVVLLGWLDEMRRTIAATPPPEDVNLRRTILNQTYTQLLWSRDLFAELGFDEFAGAVDAQLEWIRTNT